MIGLVLCGGNSTRMGTDKGMLPIGNTTWAQHAGSQLAALGLPVVYSVNESQVPAYTEQGIKPLITDDVELQMGGPLKGILSVHRQYPTEDIFLLACDLKDMHADVLQQVQAAFNGTTTIYENAGFDEPLCGIYTAEALAQLAGATLPKYSMRFVLGLIPVQRLMVPGNWRGYFFNYNE
ncbi:molybdenum cofactor guanylyltransferase [Chitinophaga horti]|uniref:Molybdenum cofactor guanylyltransferase n=1 Tax=Chitinophaga horti TaxID=2920382 RepID=A0ABY6IVK7_9BACT|nr:molybdenum cofactor guanylyltransferase [Chitinophaga horti]UYQ91403.1 molybdenum cofactor guanylyltransferase [Chitinophaga horti]